MSVTPEAPAGGFAASLRASEASERDSGGFSVVIPRHVASVCPDPGPGPRRERALLRSFAEMPITRELSSLIRYQVAHARL